MIKYRSPSNVTRLMIYIIVIRSLYSIKMARNWFYKNHTPEGIPSFLDPQKIAVACDIFFGAVRELVF